MPNTRRHAFTLVELLVAVGVIGILAALLFPVVIKARSQARKTTCLSNLWQIGLALNLYEQDWGQYAPQGWNDNSQGLEVVLPDPLAAYTHGAALYQCPETRCDYSFRGSLELDMQGHYKSSQMTPDSVLAWCAHRFDTEKDKSGFCQILRQDMSVSRVPAADVKTWYYINGTWQPNAPASESYQPGVSVFPGETWPLPFAN